MSRVFMPAKYAGERRKKNEAKAVSWQNQHVTGMNVCIGEPVSGKTGHGMTDTDCLILGPAGFAIVHNIQLTRRKWNGKRNKEMGFCAAVPYGMYGRRGDILFC